MSDTLDVGSGPNRLRIQGLRTTMRALAKAGADAEDMRELMHDLGMIVVKDAQPPHRSGKLAGTLRAGKGKTKAVVRAGYASVPYAGVIHYGWPARNIKPQPFLTESLERRQPAIFKALEEGINEIITKNGLK